MEMRQVAIAMTILLASPQWSHAQLPAKQQRDAIAFLRAPNICDGTGFFISSRHVLTCSHVATTVRMEVWVKGVRYYGTVVKRGRNVDWALLEVRDYSCPNPIKTAKPVLKERSWSYGYPGSRDLEITTGDVSFDHFVGMWSMGGKAQMGMSGGPVVNRKGQAIGIVAKMGPWGATLFEMSQSHALE
jgi:hypothetical protein